MDIRHVCRKHIQRNLTIWYTVAGETSSKSKLLPSCYLNMRGEGSAFGQSPIDCVEEEFNEAKSGRCETSYYDAGETVFKQLDTGANAKLADVVSASNEIACISASQRSTSRLAIQNTLTIA